MSNRQLRVTGSGLLTAVLVGGEPHPGLIVASSRWSLSTVTMPARVFAGTAAWWEIAASLAIAVLFAGLTIRIAARAYRSSVLHTGSRLTAVHRSCRHVVARPRGGCRRQPSRRVRPGRGLVDGS